jgi:hypothetical protein
MLVRLTKNEKFHQNLIASAFILMFLCGAAGIQTELLIALQRLFFEKLLVAKLTKNLSLFMIPPDLITFRRVRKIAKIDY